MLSHDHYDHLDHAAILALAAKAEHFLAPLGVGDRLIAWGVPAAKVQQFDWWQRHTVGGVRFVATPAQHFSGRSLFDGNKSLWASWVIMDDDLRVFFSGDTGYFDGFKAIGERFGPFDVTLMETGAYDGQWPDVHMQPEETLQAHLDLKRQVADAGPQRHVRPGHACLARTLRPHHRAGRGKGRGIWPRRRWANAWTCSNRTRAKPGGWRRNESLPAANADRALFQGSIHESGWTTHDIPFAERQARRSSPAPPAAWVTKPHWRWPRPAPTSSSADAMPARARTRCGRIRKLHPQARIRFETLDLARLASVSEFCEAPARRRETAGPAGQQRRGDGAADAAGHGRWLRGATGHQLPGPLRADRRPAAVAAQERRARVVSLASLAHRQGRIDLDDLQGERAYCPGQARDTEVAKRLLWEVSGQPTSSRL